MKETAAEQRVRRLGRMKDDIPEGFIKCSTGTKPEVGDFLFHPRSKEFIHITDASEHSLLQEEFYPLIENFGFLHLRHK